ncbi:glutamine-synthetase adenylyltransferase [Leifsonia xyli subsp. xyli]|uniref:Bifunctional glutamine synthetase adenylyltransferase/adenylyl-removing enzyme n=2 Tax=Leifsonia xyli subsp. xyli TaxID=59736 RepID=GLNE_LEIXX|nr:bifunctional [glutamine synthetase] adenylyltransferase/[glutamine synthetase]-adenylyl-L-tyrosine phosphorylase [Leifsonia xyli]Q6AFH2.1 RecName: Full=Bifunctional glutamine synthetase adenylyltransferase/adenylyl-removing enzyme; AltName: Full=ATP:glutamine synthetase adenylyltransferase; AltName: Full=ATase; Includes: RecName: Full=Glutamine synthetase adenylyl-L-tyrosine phosphorylase; AltName: Full=Adenylyl removase; Short=AR; Short=AT-N; Includes: RecName: Full=Glutamine synthetase adenyl
MTREQLSLTVLARAGFVGLSSVRAELEELATLTGFPVDDLLPALLAAADPDTALRLALRLLRRAPDQAAWFLRSWKDARRLLRVIGASEGAAEFFLRQPVELASLHRPVTALPTAAELREDLLDAVGAVGGFASVAEEEAWTALRVRYRRRLVQLASFDLEQDDPVAGFDGVAAALSDLAGAALDASLAVARRQASGSGPGRFPEAEVRATRFAIIGMGKAGARELNYVSDVDVIYVTDGAEDAGVPPGRAVDIATRLAVLTQRGIQDPALEPGLWEVDSNLRPEGRDGALVRTLDSHLAYYDRWAKGWEFQALLKARSLAGDWELGERYVTALAPRVWSSASRENFVESVQRMRERVTDNIPDGDLHYQLKLGPGGLRDVEFTVQLLQLVHGQTDGLVRQRDTLSALAALAGQSYIGREEAAAFSHDYRTLRLLEHRLQLRHLRRTHLMPRDEVEVRILARATGLAASAGQLLTQWNEIKHRVRGLHERLFYRPLLSAVAAMPNEDARLSGEAGLTSEQAQARLAAIGFRDPRGALAHIAALTAGVSRRATIQRHLLPVMLQWFSAGADPDYGLLSFRRLSDDLGGTHWYLRMLRDSSGAAERLTRVLSGSRFVAELLGRIPESVAWLESEEELRPRAPELLREETAAILARHESAETAAAALRAVRRREVLRLAFSGILGFSTIEELARGLSAVTENLLTGVLGAIRAARDDAAALEFAIIGMGRFGGRELGFGSDADIMYVFRPLAAGQDAAHRAATAIVADLNRLTEDSALPVDLDIGLRPEGKNGPSVRSLDSYRAYYARWSLAWEAQALLRARGVAGDSALIGDFETLADEVRYPASIGEQAVREVKRIKARIENERLPQGADPARHLKLGRGSLSDVEWFVQLVQLQHAAAHPALRTPSTLDALAVAAGEGFVSGEDAARLRAAWVFASRARSAMTLWTNKTADVLPFDRVVLDGVARLLEYPPGAASRMEEDYLAVTRRARAVFEREFYGPPQRPATTA